MPLSIYDASAPVLVKTLTNMKAWLDKAAASGVDEKAIIEATLADDMRPFPFQIQAASDSAKGAVARLTGGTAPSMADIETTFAELKARLQATIDYIQSVPAAAFDGAETREIELKFPNGMGYRFTGADYLVNFVLPNLFFHSGMAYALLRANGVAVSKPDVLQHLGMPVKMDEAA